MSRHRDFQKFDRSEYSHSYSESEDDYDYGVSPASPSMAQFMYKGGHQPEQTYDPDEELYKAVDNVYGVIGDDAPVTEDEVIAALQRFDFDEEKAVSALLAQIGSKSPGGKRDEDVFSFDEEDIPRPKAQQPQPKAQPKPQQPQPKAQPKPQQPKGQQGKAQPSTLAQNLNSVHQKGPSFTSQFLSSVSLQPHQTSTLPAGVKPFDFNEPSPDDVVLEKRKQAFKQKKSEQYNIKSDTKPAAAKPAAGGAKPQQPATPKKAPAAAPAEEKEKEKEEAEVDSVAKALDEVSLSEKIAKKQVKQMPDSKRREIETQIKAEQQSEGSKRNLSMVVIGHVDAGKSTIMGHLLHLCGHVDKKTITKYERDSKVLGKGSFSFAWVLDEQEEERARGVTMDVAVRRLETENRRITLLDAPGHRDFVPNMISGTAQADVAVLVIDSSPGEFEAGFAADGQTKEHALLARSLGVMQLTVVVNKMDAVDWSKERFEEVQNIVGAFLKQAGFLLKNVTWVPCSGLTGENLIARKDPKLTAWYSGPTLVQSIDSFRPGQRPTEKPLRFCVSDVFKSGSLGVGAVGKVETGIVSLLVMPIGELCTVKSIQAHEESVKWAQAGDNVELTVQGLDVVSFKVGSVLCDPEHPVRVATAFKAQIYVFPTQIPIIKGFQAVLHTHTLHEPAHLSKLVATIDQASGEVKKKRPRCLTEKMTAVVEVVTLKPVCVELFRDYKQLGRFMLRSGGRTVAAGLISEIIH